MADHGKKKARRRKHQPMGLEILHEDRDIIVVNKAAGLLTMGTGRDGGRTAHAALELAHRPEYAGATIVVILASFGERYLSTVLYEGLGT